MYLLLPIHFLMGPIQGAVVNWAGHKYGYRNFPDEKDQSKNTLFIDFLMLGELYQNNHHHAGARPNFAAKWWEFDPVYPVIKFFDMVGIIKLIPIKYQ
jgi:stearoyl-CoA desaturase (delta-9 desaturase)